MIHRELKLITAQGWVNGLRQGCVNTPYIFSASVVFTIYAACESQILVRMVFFTNISCEARWMDGDGRTLLPSSALGRQGHLGTWGSSGNCLLRWACEQQRVNIRGRRIPTNERTNMMELHCRFPWEVGNFITITCSWQMGTGKNQPYGAETNALNTPSSVTWSSYREVFNLQPYIKCQRLICRDGWDMDYQSITLSASRETK